MSTVICLCLLLRAPFVYLNQPYWLHPNRAKLCANCLSSKTNADWPFGMLGLMNPTDNRLVIADAISAYLGGSQKIKPHEMRGISWSWVSLRVSKLPMDNIFSLNLEPRRQTCIWSLVWCFVQSQLILYNPTHILLPVRKQQCVAVWLGFRICICAWSHLMCGLRVL